MNKITLLLFFISFKLFASSQTLIHCRNVQDLRRNIKINVSREHGINQYYELIYLYDDPYVGEILNGPSINVTPVAGVFDRYYLGLGLKFEQLPNRDMDLDLKNLSDNFIAARFVKTEQLSYMGDYICLRLGQMQIVKPFEGDLHLQSHYQGKIEEFSFRKLMQK